MDWQLEGYQDIYHIVSPDSMDKKFGRNYVSNDGLFELFGRYESRDIWSIIP